MSQKTFYVDAVGASPNMPQLEFLIEFDPKDRETPIEIISIRFDGADVTILWESFSGKWVKHYETELYEQVYEYMATPIERWGQEEF